MSTRPFAPRAVQVALARQHVPELALHRQGHEAVHGTHAVGRFNQAIALAVTSSVGSMWCAYAFCLLALVSLPSVYAGFRASHDPTQLVAWVAQTFLQLVLLPIIIVGQNVQAAASDARARADHETLNAVHVLTSEVHAINERQTAILERLDGKAQP